MDRWHPASHRCPATGRDPKHRRAARRRCSGFNGTELNIFATLAHHPRLLKRWSAFGGIAALRRRAAGTRARAPHPPHRLPVPGALRVGPARRRSGWPPGSPTTRSLAWRTDPTRHGLVGRRRRSSSGPPTSSTPTAASATTRGRALADAVGRAAAHRGVHGRGPVPPGGLDAELARCRARVRRLPGAPGMSGVAGRSPGPGGRRGHAVDRRPRRPDRQRPGHRRRRRSGRGHRRPAPTSTWRPPRHRGPGRGRGRHRPRAGRRRHRCRRLRAASSRRPPPRWTASTGSCCNVGIGAGHGDAGHHARAVGPRVRGQRPVALPARGRGAAR